MSLPELDEAAEVDRDDWTVWDWLVSAWVVEAADWAVESKVDAAVMSLPEEVDSLEPVEVTVITLVSV